MKATVWKKDGCLIYTARDEFVGKVVHAKYANLVAVAPELLAALEAYMSDCGDWAAVMPSEARVNQFRAAIAKAKGE